MKPKTICSSGKRRYGVREHAENVAAKLRAKGCRRSRVYYRPECGNFHVTTRGGLPAYGSEALLHKFLVRKGSAYYCKGSQDTFVFG